jgi:spoIIIJ-associated protein
MSYQKKFFSGNSVEQAVLQAARHFKLEASEVAYRKVERRHGFLKTRRRAVIEVDAENPRRQQDVAAQASPAESVRATAVPEVDAGARVVASPSTAPPAAAGASEPVSTDTAESPKLEDEELTALPESPTRPDGRYERAEGDVAEAAQEGIRRLLRLGKLNVEAEVYQGEEGLEVEIRGEDEASFLEDRGRLLLAMQHLLPRVLRGLTGETIPCRVDCDNFQEIRAEQLRVLAQRVAAEVRELGRSRTLEPMSPDERRIVHVTLADDAAVETESQGSGLFKRVMVMPVRRQSRGFDPYN